MAKNSISLQIYALVDGVETRCDDGGHILTSVGTGTDADDVRSKRPHPGPFKLKWREWVEEDGIRIRKGRSKNCSTLDAVRALHAKTQIALEAGEVAPEAKARNIPTLAALDQIALGWLRFKAAKGRAGGTVKVYQSSMARIFSTIRKVRHIAADVAVPASALSVTLFSELQTQWQRDDAAAGRSIPGAQAASPWRIYDLSLVLFKVWQWAASQPDEWPGVPAAPQDRDLVLPRTPPRPAAPDAPTWAEMDAIVRRAYARNRDLGDVLAGLRCTGLRVDQVQSIRRRAIDVKRATLIVEVGKSAAEKAEQRKVPIPRDLLELWMPRISTTSGEDYIFPAARSRQSGHVEVSTTIEAELWHAAEQAEEVRVGIHTPRTRRKGRPNHAFRAGYMAGLEACTARVEGQDVRLVPDKVIDYLVGHHAATTRDRHYASPTPKQLEAAVALVPELDLVGPGVEVEDDNVVQLHKR